MNTKDSGRESPAASTPLENYDTKEIADPSSQHEEKTAVIYGEENVRNWALQRLSTVNSGATFYITLPVMKIIKERAEHGDERRVDNNINTERF